LEHLGEDLSALMYKKMLEGVNYPLFGIFFGHPEFGVML
jgi:hypothetical protein